MQRYNGMDVHASSCTLAVMGSTGKRIRELVVETDERVLRSTLKAIAGTRRLSMEEGCADWVKAPGGTWQ